MSKQKIFMWLTLAAAVLCLGAFAYADTSATVFGADGTKISVDRWETLAKAVASVEPTSGEVTITLTDNINAPKNGSLDIASGKHIILSLNGKMLAMSGDENRNNPGGGTTSGYFVAISNDGYLKITGGGSIDVKGVDSADVSQTVNVYGVYNTGSLDVTDCALSATGGSSTGVYNNGGTVYLVCNEKSGDVTITGAVLTATGGNSVHGGSGNAHAIHNPDGIVNVSDTTLTAVGGATSNDTQSGGTACGIYNGAAYHTACTVNVAEVVITVRGGVTSSANQSGGVACGVYNFWGRGIVSDATITVVGGANNVGRGGTAYGVYCGYNNITINSATVKTIGGTGAAVGERYAIYKNSTNGVVRVWDGHYEGNLGNPDYLKGALHGGEYFNCGSIPGGMVAEGCILKEITGGYRIVNAVLSADKEKITVANGKTEKIAFDLCAPVGGEKFNVTTVELSCDLPECLTAVSKDVTGSTFSIVVSNDGCEVSGDYKITVTAKDAENHHKASHEITVIVSAPERRGDSSSSGCNAGFAPLAVLAFAFVQIWQKSRCRDREAFHHTIDKRRDE